MAKVYIDSECWIDLNEWSDNNKWRVINALPFYKNVTIQLKDFPEYEGHFEAKKYGYKFRLRENKRQFCVGKVTVDENADNDISIHFDLSKELNAKTHQDDWNEIWENVSFKIQTFVNIFLCVNAYLWYGNLADDKKLIAQGRNLDNSKIIVFRKYKGETYAIPVNHHKSPEGVFEVRGHFRAYKTGKVIWIDGYLKGTDKE